MMESHLKDCADCLEWLADLRRLSDLVASAPLAAMSPESMARLSAGWRAARDRGLLRITRWLTAAAAGILFGTLLFWPDHPGGAGQNIAASEPVWETVAVMPPPIESDDSLPDVVVLAQWMANDLSYGERQ